MATYDELVVATAAIQKVLDDGAAARLRAIPGVTQVGYGAKERGGKVTRELCIRVYVNKKLPLESVPEHERIPSEIDGIPTDVNIVPSFRFLDDDKRYRPLVGGISISNKVYFEKDGEIAWGVGTFGCTATLPNGKPALLSCSHVLMSHGAGKDDYIFQPAPVDPPNIPVPTQPILHPPKDDDMIAKIVAGVLTDRVDAAVAQLDVSSCCRCCGLDFHDEIVELSKDGRPATNKIVGMREPMPTKAVFKRGMRTQRMEGILLQTNFDIPIFDLEGTNHPFVGQLLIASVDENEPFSWSGDSGSAIIDEDGFIVGLLFGGTLEIDADQRSYANHITEVCSALGITINLTKTTHTAGAMTSPPPIAVTTSGPMWGAELYREPRERLLADPAGAWLFALAEEHREEIVQLVTTVRPVTVAWHRAGGPALFAAGLNTVRAGGSTLPVPATGSLESALAKVGNALAAHGSPALRDAIATHREVLLAAARDSVTLDDVLEKLRAAVFTEA